jgi:hypothetical protein
MVSVIHPISDQEIDLLLNKLEHPDLEEAHRRGDAYWLELVLTAGAYILDLRRRVPEGK